MAILIEEGTTNLIKNASFETGTLDAWIVNGSTVSIQSSEKHCGNYAIQITDNNTSASVSISQTTSASAGTTYTLSAWAKIVSGKQYMALDFLDTSSAVLASYVIPFTEVVWTRKAVVCTAPTNTTQMRVRLYSTIPDTSNGYWDDVQVEAKVYATSVVYTNDTSTQIVRSPESLTIPTAGVLNPQEGEISIRVYVPFVINAGDFARIWQIPGATAMGIALWYRTRGNWELRTHADDNTYTTGTAPVSLTPTGWHLFSVKWTTTQAVLYIDGVARVTINNPKLPSSFAANAYIGSNNTGGQQLNTLFDDLRISSRARTDAEIAAAYASGQPLLVDEWTTAKLNFDGVLGLYEANVSNPSYGTDTINSLVKTVFYVDTNNVLRPLGTIVLRDSREELLPRTRDYTETVPGRDGEWDFGSEFEPRLLEFHCAVEINPEERTAFKRQLAKYLSPKNGPQPLVFGDDLGKVYYVKYSGQIDLTQYPEWLDFTIPFKMSDPYIKSTTTKTHVGDGIIINDGNVECPIVITILGPTSTAVTITIGSESITYNAAIPSGQTLIIDTEKLTAKVNNINVLGYISGTFVKLPVGESNVTITGTSAQSVTINYTERWI